MQKKIKFKQIATNELDTDYYYGLKKIPKMNKSFRSMQIDNTILSALARKGIKMICEYNVILMIYFFDYNLLQ